MARTAALRRDQVRQVMKGIVVVGALLFVTLAYQLKWTAPSTALGAAAERGVPRQRDDAGARAAFLAAYPVFMHPRCMNCHPEGDVPLQGDDSHLHAQSVKRGPNGHGKYGMKCNACHQATNLPGLNMPPGVATWHLAPRQMVFQGKTPGEFCRQLKDPRRNGGKNVAGAIEHLEADPLVLWGWSPGEGQSSPPLSHAEFVQKMREWVNKGAACP